jgi:hypothetical protein
MPVLKIYQFGNDFLILINIPGESNFLFTFNRFSGVVCFVFWFYNRKKILFVEDNATKLNH